MAENWSRVRRWAALAAFATVAPLALTACGVPISAEELAKTPLAIEAGEAKSAQVFSRPLSASQEAAPTPLPEDTPGPTAAPAPASAATAALATSTPVSAATATPAAATPSPTAAQTTAATSPTAAQTTAATSPSPRIDLGSQAVMELNAYRASIGLARLNEDPALKLAAQRYAKMMADYNWWQCRCDPHVGPDGSQPQHRIVAAGYSGRFRGEALSGGQNSARGVIDAWLASGPHMAIILDTRATDVGIGYFFKPGDWLGHYWVLVTGVRD